MIVFMFCGFNENDKSFPKGRKGPPLEGDLPVRRSFSEGGGGGSRRFKMANMILHPRTNPPLNPLRGRGLL
jgi:hypothetical protein